MKSNNKSSYFSNGVFYDCRFRYGYDLCYDKLETGWNKGFIYSFVNS